MDYREELEDLNNQVSELLDIMDQQWVKLRQAELRVKHILEEDYEA
ncbi:MAG: hypothetical protein RSF90_02975 [Pygmaiobacter sp.]